MIAGIFFQWYTQLGEKTWWLMFFTGFISIILFFFIPFFKRYHFYTLSGLAAGFIFMALGGLIAFQKDIRNDKSWLRNFYQEQNSLVVTLDEPPVEKTKSIKANAVTCYLLQDGKQIAIDGKIIVYFQKDSLNQALKYGTQIIFKKPLQEIKNSGNPGGFNYKRYALFQGITHQVFLKKEEFEILPSKKENWFRKFIYSCRTNVLNILRKNIKGEKELGLAEALLIGYKDDLEESLVQSYTNTGVVHIIAISGLHLGLIYWLLSLIFSPLKKRKHIAWLRPLLIITNLWLFSILAGGQPSILRSAVMFTCIVIGENLSKKTSLYNTMAVSAFILLCINPYWLWDVGFQLSYAAVLSIIIFMQPVYNWLYIKNKILDALWKLNAVTIAAQILTIPLSIYHFHQFPVWFILTNFIAVPLSSAIVLAEIFLCFVFFIPSIALLAGKVISWAIWIMNSYIERIEKLPFSIWDGLQITIYQALLLFLFSTGMSYWLIEKSKAGIKVGLVALLGFIGLRSYSFIESSKQQKLIVYNVPQKRAIDMVTGRKYLFIGDSDLLQNDFLRNFHLKPARILYRMQQTISLENFRNDDNHISFNGKHILLLDKTVSYRPQQQKSKIDLLVISKNPKLYINNLGAAFDIKQVVFDGSVPSWKSSYWKKACDSLHIPWFDVTVSGAFQMTMR